MRFFLLPRTGPDDSRPADSTVFKMYMAENPILKSDYKIF